MALKPIDGGQANGYHLSDGCRAAAAGVALATTASWLVAKRPESLHRYCVEARHSAERLSKRTGSRWPCIGSSRARRKRWRSSRSTVVKPMATISAMAVVPRLHAWPSPPQRRGWLPSGVRVFDGTLPRLGTWQRGLASVHAQDGHTAAAAEHVVSDGAQADRRWSSRWLPFQRWLSCRRCTHGPRRHSVVAGC